MSNTKTIGPSAVNEARVTFFRTSTHLDNPTGGKARFASLGFVTGVGTLGIIPDATPGFPEYVPQIYFNNFTIGAPSLITFQPNNTYTVSDGFSKVIGRHTLKFGGEFRYLQINERNLASQDGAFVFDGTVTGNRFRRLPPWGDHWRWRWIHARQRYNSWIRARAMALRMLKTHGRQLLT